MPRRRVGTYLAHTPVRGEMSDFLRRLRFARDHRWAPDRMSDYLDGELAAARQVRMDRHVGECVECRRLLAGLRVMLEALHGLPASSGEVDALQIAASVRPRLDRPRRPHP